MTSLKFDPSDLSIILDVDIKASLPTISRLALDTGASYVMLPWKLASGIGITINPTNTAKVMTATTVETAPRVTIPEITVLGKTVKNVEALIKDLPPQSHVDGLLGLSFLKHFKITIDFKKGLLTLE